MPLFWDSRGITWPVYSLLKLLNAISILTQTPLKKLGFHKMLKELAGSNREIACALVFVCVG